MSGAFDLKACFDTSGLITKCSYRESDYNNIGNAAISFLLFMSGTLLYSVTSILVEPGNEATQEPETLNCSLGVAQRRRLEALICARDFLW